MFDWTYPRRRYYYSSIMASDRVQRQIDSLLDEAEAAIKELDWRVVHDRAEAVLAIDPENPDGLTYLATAANGRYEVKRFLGEGGKKKVYLAQDTQIGRAHV